MSEARHLRTNPEPNALLPVNKRDSVFVNTAAPLSPGCAVALLYRDKRFKPKFGRYWPGKPPTFAEFVDVWDNRPDAKLKKPRPISSIAWPVRLLGMQRKYLPNGIRRKGGAHA